MNTEQQKQAFETFERIDKMESRIARLEKWIIGGLGAILLAVLSNHM